MNQKGSSLWSVLGWMLVTATVYVLMEMLYGPRSQQRRVGALSMVLTWMDDMLEGSVDEILLM
jgi:hypothetical protein